MVKRKPSRAYSRTKPLKPKVTIDDDDEDAEMRKETLLKRLDDFDMQVKDVLLKMEADKQSTIDSIRHLYYVDEQRTPVDINNMLWTTFLTQNTPCPRSEIRESIAKLVHKVENQQLMTGTQKRSKRKMANTPADPPPPPPQLLHSKSRQPKTVSRCNRENAAETPVPSATRTRRGKKNGTMSTPLNQGITTLPVSLLITPKFDPRTPIPATSLRKPKFGEIAVSLKGSPLQIGTKDLQIESLREVDLDPQTREELMELHQKVSELLSI